MPVIRALIAMCLPVTAGRARWGWRGWGWRERGWLGQLLTVFVEEHIDRIVGFGLDRAVEVVVVLERVEFGQVLVIVGVRVPDLGSGCQRRTLSWSVKTRVRPTRPLPTTAARSLADAAMLSAKAS
jgi:hypothetical protein